MLARSSLLYACCLLIVSEITHAAAPSACNAPALPVTGTRIINVTTESQLQSAVSNLQNGDTLLIANGTYPLSNTLYIAGKSNITVRGASGCDNVVLAGGGMENATGIQVGIWSNSLNTTIAHLTIRDTYDNSIVFNGGAQSPHVYSVKLLNAGSQFVKSNPVNDGSDGLGVNSGILEYSWMEYTSGTPNHANQPGYTNGISAHAAQNWIIRGNLFKNFHTPDTASYLWNPAVLFWNHSVNTVTEQNVFINVDRAVGYGLMQRPTGTDHAGGVIRNNFIYQAPGLFSPGRASGSDGLIIADASPNTKVYHNTVLANGNSNFGIEFRFPETSGGEARNNLMDSGINLRDSATAALSGNLLNATAGLFVSPGTGDLHLLPGATAAIDKGTTLTAVTTDIDGDSRPQGAGYDIGADERAGSGSSACDLNGDTVSNVVDVQVCANQAIGATICTNGDIDLNGTCNVVDVQRVVNAALGGACVSP